MIDRNARILQTETARRRRSAGPAKRTTGRVGADDARQEKEGDSDARAMDEKVGLHLFLCRLQHRAGQRVAIPVPLLQERRRYA